jgi:hypothetical protein
VDTLYTFAEVAVAFAGFASIVVVFRRRDQGEWSADDATAYRAMLFNSLFACAFSLLPAVLTPFEMPSSVLWASCSGLFLVYATWRILDGTVLNRRSPPRILLVSAVAAILAQAANVVGIPFGRGQPLYLVGVGLLIFIAGYNFFRLVGVPPPRSH